MRAVVYDECQGPVEVREVPDPAPPYDGVVVEVHATGLCRSDWHAWAGHDDIDLPHVPGHELAGVVSAVGDGVLRWSIGDRVTVPFVCGCGRCEWCESGNAQVCPRQRQPGFTDWGSFAEYVALPAADTNLIAVPESVSMAAAAGLGCRFATAYRGLVSRAAVAPDEWVGVLGAGGVGLSGVLIAKSFGARVLVIDRHTAALELATRLGADAVLLADDVSSEAVADLTGGGAHVSVDAVGSEETCAVSIEILRRRGRQVQIGLLPPVGGNHPRVPMARVIAWELDLLGSHGMAASDYPPLMAAVASGALRPELLIEREVGLSEGARMLPLVEHASPVGVTIIDPRRD